MSNLKKHLKIDPEDFTGIITIAGDYNNELTSIYSLVDFDLSLLGSPDYTKIINEKVKLNEPIILDTLFYNGSIPLQNDIIRSMNLTKVNIIKTSFYKGINGQCVLPQSALYSSHIVLVLENNIIKCLKHRYANPNISVHKKEFNIKKIRNEKIMQINNS